MIDLSISDLDEIYSSGKTIAELYAQRYQEENIKQTIEKNVKYDIVSFIKNLNEIRKEMLQYMKVFANETNVKKYFGYDTSKMNTIDKHEKINKYLKVTVGRIKEYNRIIVSTYSEIPSDKYSNNIISEIRKYRTELMKQKSENTQLIKSNKKLILNVSNYLDKTDDDRLKSLYILRFFNLFIELLTKYNSMIDEFLKISR